MYTHRIHKNLMVHEITVNTSVPLKIKLHQNCRYGIIGIIGIIKETEIENLSRQSAFIVWTKVLDTIDIEKSPQMQSFRYLVIMTTNLTTENPKGAYIKYVGGRRGGGGGFYKFFGKFFVAQDTVDLHISWPSNFFQKTFHDPSHQFCCLRLTCSSISG